MYRIISSRAVYVHLSVYTGLQVSLPDDEISIPELRNLMARFWGTEREGKRWKDMGSFTMVI